MRFWLKTAHWSMYLVVGCAVGSGVWREFGGKTPAQDLAVSFVLFGMAMFLSGGILVFLHLNRNEPQLVRLASWLGFKTNPVDESQKK